MNEHDHIQSSNEQETQQREAPRPKSQRVHYKKLLEKALAENNQLRDQLLRLAAEFENYRKRNERNRSFEIENAHVGLILSLLPVLDDLGRSIVMGDEKKDFNSFLEGVKLVEKNFMKILRDKGLEPMESVGQHFDPNQHEALLQVEIKDQESGVIVDEHVKGYLYKDRVIRHAKVVVNK